MSWLDCSVCNNGDYASELENVIEQLRIELDQERQLRAEADAKALEWYGKLEDRCALVVELQQKVHKLIQMHSIQYADRQQECDERLERLRKSLRDETK